MIEGLAELTPLLMGLGGGAIGLVKGIVFVREGERAVLLSFDKAVRRGGVYRVVEPGLRLMIPGVHKLARTHVRVRTINLPPQTIVLNDKTVFEVSAVLTGRVKDTPQDLYNALFETNNLNDALSNCGLAVVRRVLSRRGATDLFGEDREAITEELTREIALQASEWGFGVTGLELSDCKPNDETARLLQTSTQTQFKVAALKEAAAQLGTDATHLNPTLAAVLVGVPLTATTGSSAIEFAEEE